MKVLLPRDPTTEGGGGETTEDSVSGPSVPLVTGGSGQAGEVNGSTANRLCSRTSLPLSSPHTQDRPHSTVDDNQQEGSSRLSERHRVAKASTSHRCQICDDSASGFHYGVWSCEGCKAFFKRSLQGLPPDYVCPAINNCTIDKQRRQSCKACRLRKCYAVGMFRNIRKEKSSRQSRVTTKRRSAEALCEPSTTSPCLAPKIKREEPGESDDANTHSYISKLMEAGQPEPVARAGAPVHPLVQVLLKIEPPPRMTCYDTSGPPTERTLMSSLLKLANAEIVDIINWAKSIPGYTKLELQQRIRLLESSWMEVLIAGLLWRSMPYPDTLVFSQDFRWTREMCKAANMVQVGDNLMLLSQSFAHLSLTQEEFVLLRAMTLLNGDVRQGVAGHNTQLGALQDNLQQALHYTVVKRLKKNVSHVSRLLLILPHIRQAALNSVSHISSLSTRHVVSVEMLDLLQEMLQASAPLQYSY